MRQPREIDKIDNWTYHVPLYRVTNEGIENYNSFRLEFCRGNKANEADPRQEGFFTETLLEVCLQYLQSVNVGELANRDTSLAITHIEDALLRINKRAEDRKKRNVQATYNK